MDIKKRISEVGIKESKNTAIFIRRAQEKNEEPEQRLNFSNDFFEYTSQVFDPQKVSTKPKPLEGITVIDNTMVVLGAIGPMILSTLGATVIKVEGPKGDYLWREAIPFWTENGSNVQYSHDNCNKYFISVDLHKPEGVNLFKKLVAKSDILVENLTPENFDDWGVGYKDLIEVNPRLIYIWAGGWGRWGKYLGIPSYDALGQAMSGLSYASGFQGRPPMRATPWVGDYLGGVTIAAMALVGLFYREKTGRGCYMEIGHSANLTRYMGWIWPYVSTVGENPPRMGNIDAQCGPSGVFRCKDGFVAIAAVLDKEWAGLCEAMGKPELSSKYPNIASRMKKESLVDLATIINEWAKTKTTDELIELAEKYGFACDKVMSCKDLVESEHLRYRRQIQFIDDSLLKEKICLPGIPIHFSETPWSIKWAARPHGSHNEYVLKNVLGLSEGEIEELKKKKVIVKGR